MVVEVTVECEDELLMPTYASEEAAGADLRAALKEPLVLLPGNSCLIPTGLRLALPVGYELQIRPRSGLALKHGISVLNSPGTVDSDYRGEVGVILINHGLHPFTVERGMRVAQAVVTPVTRARFTIAQSPLQVSARGTGGFGHSGLH